VADQLRVRRPQRRAGALSLPQASPEGTQREGPGADVRGPGELRGKAATARTGRG
jgi:hypothetical protein